jgi:hypothetical protein
MQRTMFDRGFRPSATTLGHGQAMASSFTDALKKYTSMIYPSTNVVPGTVPIQPPVIRQPEPTILGMPQSTAMWTGAAVLGVGVVAAVVYSQKKK